MLRLVTIIITMTLVFINQVSAYAAEIPAVEIKSEAAVLLDSETGAILYAKNAEERLFPASLTKIATAIYAIDKGQLDDIVTISSRAVAEEGTKVFLVEGEQVPLKKLIQGMLINSGNDAAVAIAEHLDGSVESFSESINMYLRDEIGVVNTHFTNPNGLFHEQHYTTAMDLALITNYAAKNEVFAEIFGTKELPWSGQSWETKLITHHRLLKGEFPYEGITGGKTGFVNESKHTLATTAAKNELQLTAIVLKANANKDAYQDTEVLLDYGFQNFHHRSLAKNEIFESGKKEFYPDRDITITEPLTGSQLSVDDKGILSVVNNGQVYQTVELLLKEEPKQMTMKEDKQMTTEESSINGMYGIAIFALAGIFIGIRKKIANKHKKTEAM
ncbi:D-alanyl-D-alanine carboxypeptidase family protein [Neobacillus sp. K501]